MASCSADNIIAWYLRKRHWFPEHSPQGKHLKDPLFEKYEQSHGFFCKEEKDEMIKYLVLSSSNILNLGDWVNQQILGRIYVCIMNKIEVYHKFL